MSQNYLAKSRRRQFEFDLRRAQDRLARAQQEAHLAAQQVSRIEEALAQLEEPSSPAPATPASPAAMFENIAAMFGLDPQEMNELLSTDEGKAALSKEALTAGQRLKKQTAPVSAPAPEPKTEKPAPKKPEPAKAGKGDAVPDKAAK